MASDWPDFEDYSDLWSKLQGSGRVPFWARYRQGGEPDIWSRPGGYAYVTVQGFVQVGSFKWTGAAAVSGGDTQTFPVAFSDEPLIWCNVVYTQPLGVQVVCQPWSDGGGIDVLWWAAANVTEIWFHWLAFGPGDIR